MIAFHVVLPIAFAIKKSFIKSDSKKKFSIKEFFENMFYVIFPWLLIALSIFLFVVFSKLTKNTIVTAILTIVIVSIVVKTLDR